MCAVVTIFLVVCYFQRVSQTLSPSGSWRARDGECLGSPGVDSPSEASSI